LRLADGLEREPGVRRVEPNCATGRVTIQYDEGQTSRQRIMAIVAAEDRPAEAETEGGADVETERQWAVASLVPLGDRQPERLLRLAKETEGPKNRRIQWACFAGRRGLRRLGPRAFRAARLMQRRGERVLCLLQNGQPQGLFGFRERRRYRVPVDPGGGRPAGEVGPRGLAGMAGTGLAGAGNGLAGLAGVAGAGLALLTLPLSLAVPVIAMGVRRALGRWPRRPVHGHLTPLPPPAVLEAAAAAEPLAAAQGPPAWHAMPPDQTLDLLGSDPQGLCQGDAEARLHRCGPNQLREKPGRSSMALFSDQFKEPMVLILLGAAVLSFLLGERLDAIAIVGIVLVNALLAVAQDAKSRQALESLKRMTTATARVHRDGEVKVIPADQLVPGDVVVIEAGDVVPADLRLLDGNNLLTEEAALTGESGEVAKSPFALLDAAAAIGDRENMVYMGTFVRGGRGRGIVIATGMDTEMGRIAGMLQEAGPGPTPLQRRLAEVNRVLVIGALAAAAIMVGVGLLRGMPAGGVLLTATSTAVAAIPEGLPITVTIALALAVYRMGRRNAVVRHLPAVETLGATMTICTDKTGTLTCNQMTARELWVAGKRYAIQGEGYSPQGRFLVDGNTVDIAPDSDVATALRMATLCSNATLSQGPDGTWTGDGDPTEVAVLVAAARAGLAHTEIHDAHVRLHEVPFEAAARSMTVVCRDQDGRIYAHVKGAPDKVLKACTRWHLHGVDEFLTDADRALIEARAEAMAHGALRVLAVAYKPLRPDWTPEQDQGLEEELIFAGLIGLMDPPREEVRGALERCLRAGVRVMMVTGDHPNTALAVARELGFADEQSRALTGAQIEHLADAELAAALADVTVCARVAPEQKLRIVRALRSRGRVVAMTGDGVNDAPAIKEADIGIAMGRTGTEVTRATADMILMDDNFATIVGAIEEGRGTYDNIRRTVRYTLATNIAEVVLMLGAVLLAVPLPLLPVHLLWVNLVCDGLPALSLAFDKPAEGVTDRPPRRAEDGLFAGGLWRRMTVRGVALGAGILGLFGVVLGATGNVVLARSAAMAALIFSKLIFLLEVRRDGAGATRLPPNPVLTGAFLLTGLLALGSLYLPAVQPFFKTVGLGAGEWVGVGLVALLGTLLERMAFRSRGNGELEEEGMCVSNRSTSWWRPRILSAS
jgi:Ca2+-transporting ATPase